MVIPTGGRTIRRWHFPISGEGGTLLSSSVTGLAAWEFCFVPVGLSYCALHLWRVYWTVVAVKISL